MNRYCCETMLVNYKKGERIEFEAASDSEAFQKAAALQKPENCIGYHLEKSTQTRSGKQKWSIVRQ